MRHLTLPTATSEGFASGTTFEVNASKTVKKRYHIEHVEAPGVEQHGPNWFYCNNQTRIVFADPAASRPASALNQDHESALTAEYVGGLVDQLATLNNSMDRVLKHWKNVPSNLVNEGILIHGYEGTGKSLILSRLARTPGFRKIVRLDEALSESATIAKSKATIESAFQTALQNEPALILIDDLEDLTPSTDGALTSTLAVQLGKLVGSRVLVIAACRDPRHISTKITTINRLSLSVEIPVPDQDSRCDILRTLLKEYDLLEEIVADASRRTHGFTGKDLAFLVLFAQRRAASRARTHPNERNGTISENDSLETLLDGTVHSRAASDVEREVALTNGASNGFASHITLTSEDFDEALEHVKPTALRELIFEKPRIQWTDIGGYSAIKRRFDKIIGWPLHRAAEMKQLRLQPHKGVLLYGPPGCSKTLTAQAVATTYGLNFIVVKGPELNSMYVGESERAVRDIFRKARAAAPCIIFFDEIDSIASERDPAGNKGLHVVTTLLNEMDGFEALRGVFVLAATNKPESIDPALMRPGRLHPHIYLGPPNETARMEIFRMQTDDMPTEGELDVHELATATDGYSGAEIVDICMAAKAEAFDRESPVAVTMSDFQAAIAGTSKSITDDMLDTYESFAKGNSV